MNFPLHRLDDSELCRFAYISADPIVSTSLERELLTRLEGAENLRLLIDVLADLDFDIEDPDELKSQLEALDDRATEAEEALAETREELETADHTITELENQIADLRRQLDNQEPLA